MYIRGKGSESRTKKKKPAGVGEFKSIKPLGGKWCPWERERNSVVVQGTK